MAASRQLFPKALFFLRKVHFHFLLGAQPFPTHAHAQSSLPSRRNAASCGHCLIRGKLIITYVLKKKE